MPPHRPILPLLFLLAGLRIAAAAPDAVVVFNEIHYNPPGQTEEGEWLELFNQMGIKVDVSGWRIDGIAYTFPNGTIIDPGDYLVIAKNPSAGQLGPFSGNLSNSGERLRLINQSERLMDELDYGDDGRWPAAADGSGATLAKRNPYTANKPPEHWDDSAQLGGTPGSINFPDDNIPPPTSTVALLALADNWRYNESGVDLGSAWAQSSHAVGAGWEIGSGGIGFETGTNIPLNTQLEFPGFNSTVTYYFEREFELNASQFASLDSLKIRHGFDDGAVIYINGVEALRVNMPAGPISAATEASSGVEIDDLSADTPISTAAVTSGTNRISVEVHQENPGSSDVLFGLELDAEIAGAVPGAAPQIAFNEIPPATEPSFWIELVNSGPVAVELGGMTLSAAADPGREYSLPAGQLAPGGLVLVDEASLGFRPADGEKLILYDAAGTTVLDARQVTGRLRGRSADGWLYPSAATPGATNTFEFNHAIVISEIAYNPPGLAAVPAVPPTLQPTRFVSMGDNWRYNRADEDLPSGWATSAHPIGGNWEQAPGPIGAETSALPVPLATVWPSNEYQASTVTYYFETDFDIAPDDLANLVSLKITHQIDDGAVFYINGVEVDRFGMPNGIVGPETLASPGVGNAAPITTDDLNFSPLVAGSNRLSVEVHQSSPGSSDLVFGAQLDADIRTSPGIPGQPFRNSDNQWIEIANRSDAAVDLAGWQFADGIDFTFAAGTSLAPGEHACIVREPALFSAAFPGARILGEFSGSMSRSGERLELIDANKNPVDLVRFYDGGSWPGAADGGGSTLELRDLGADNGTAGAWADSDESDQTAWRNYSYTETAASSRGPDGQWDEFNMGMLGSGEILIDDITVSGGGQRITDPGFDDPVAWRLRGNHRHSEIIDDPDAPGNKVLRLVATGPTEHMHNQVETTLTNAISNGQSYQISFRARWVSGSNQLHTRLYFNRCAKVNVIDRPFEPGTPSAPNSNAAGNIGPTYTDLNHSPAVPDANEAVTVSVAADDPDGISSLTLFYSVNGGAFQNVPMGLNGGRYAGGIPGQAASAIVQFYVTGSDTLAATSSFPPAGPESRALYKVDDGRAATNGQHNFRIIMTAADVTFQHVDTEVMSNDRLEATVIDREGDIYYGCGVRLKSSERGRNNLNRVGYNVRFPADHLYRGAHESVAIDRSEGQQPGQRELLFDMMISNSGGVLSRYYDLVKVLAPNNSLTGSATFQMARYDELFLESQFEDGSDGKVYEYELIYYPTTTNNDPSADTGLKRPQPDSVRGTRIGSNSEDPELYRYFFLNKINREADDFAPIIAYNNLFAKSGADFEAGLDAVVDVDDWLRGMAYAVLTGAGDNAAAGSEHNGLYYAKPDGRIMFLPHDMDFSFNASRGIYSFQESSKLVPSNSARRRLYLGHLHDIISTTYNNSYMSIWTDHFAELDPAQNWSTDLSYMTSRSNSVLSQIDGSIAPVAFNITTSSPHTVAGATATIEGDGWVDVREIRLQGSSSPLPVTWSDGNSWELEVPAPPGLNTITIEAVNFSGEVIATDTIAIDNTTPFEPASSNNLVISEIMYHPSDPTPAEISAGFTDADQFEFVELQNIGSVVVDLTNVRFSEGIDYQFSSATTLNPGARIVVVRDRQAFLSRHVGGGVTVAEGEFLNGTGLSNNGEPIELLSAGGTAIRGFAYDDDTPWPTAADGDGYSLVLIAPTSNPDHALAQNWRSSSSEGGNPGSSDASSFVGDPNADDDSDGLSAFLEYALGLGDGIPNGSPVEFSADPTSGLMISHSRNLAADDATLELEISDDLKDWLPAAGVFEIDSETPNGDGTSTVSYRYLPQTPADRSLFLRISARMQVP